MQRRRHREYALIAQLVVLMVGYWLHVVMLLLQAPLMLQRGS
jgi:hypothetical protein